MLSRNLAPVVLIALTACGSPAQPALFVPEACVHPSVAAAAALVDGDTGAQAAPAAAAPPAPAPGRAPAEANEAAWLVVPTACDGRADRCTPPSGFVERLCSGSHPDVALAMFSKGTPWTRGYLSRDVEAWRASGRASSAMTMGIGEEVLVVARRDGGGMIVGGGSYDVLRWNGSCASLMADELEWKRPADAGHALVPWRKLGDRTREALASHAEIARLEVRRRRECRTAAFGGGSPACAEIDQRLSGSVVTFVRSGGALPLPEVLR